VRGWIVCVQVVLDLASDPRSPSQARRFVADLCERLGLDEICADVTLPVSELVTNALLHASTPATLTVSVATGFIEVSVRDSSPREPVIRPVRLDPSADIDAAAARSPDLPIDLRDAALHIGEAGSVAAGRGLLIVEAVSDEWGVTRLTVGKEIWFRVRTPPGWTAHPPCPCPGSRSTTPGGLPLRIPAFPMVGG
jgi:anti-sigma regulatory factor (Ser/Thr protein kinase)